VRDTSGSFLDSPVGKLATPRWLQRKIARPPRKIRRWVAKTGARYAPGRGWYVLVPPKPLSAYPPPSNPRGGAAPWNGEQLVVVPLEPPCNWPVSDDVRAMLAAERFARIADSYEGIPGPVKDPTEDTIAASLLAGAAAVFHAIVRRH
jgi:hypothetical protein